MIMLNGRNCEYVISKTNLARLVLLTQHDNDLNSLLRHHLPEVHHGGRQWGLGSNELGAAQAEIINVSGIDVVVFARCKHHSCIII